MIKLFYALVDETLSLILQQYSSISKFLQTLTLPMQSRTKILSHYKVDDQVRSLLSELFKYQLLAKFMQCHPSEIVIQYDIFQRPFLVLPNSNSYDFNISHSGNYVLMAISDLGQVGVDIEIIDQDINYNELKPLTFSEYECQSINNAKDFFNLWSKKEALIKAVGKGFLDNMYQLTELKHDFIEMCKYKNVDYKFEKLFIHDFYSSYLCYAVPAKDNPHLSAVTNITHYSIM